VTSTPNGPIGRTKPELERLAEANIPTEFGVFRLCVYQAAKPATASVNGEQIALVMGTVRDREEIPVRVHSECLTGEVFGSLRCDCKQQLETAEEKIAAFGAGVIIYLRQEGRGIGLANKIRAYALQEQGADTVDANRLLHLPVDARHYGAAAAILDDLGIRSIKLMTNNPMKVQGLEALGVKVVERIPLVVPSTHHSAAYLEAKRHRLQHEIPSSAFGFGVPEPSAPKKG
jgi:GTP cyclohydrolase II